MNFTIFTAPSRFNVNWREEFVGWEDFAARCASPVVTSESAEEFRAMDRDRQCAAKDCGGFVGGRLKDGKRRAGSVLCRTLITLDYDHAPALPMAEQPVVLALARSGWTALVYTTHSHSEASPRFRVVIPLKVPLPPDRYEEVARAVAAELGTEGIDSTTYDAERLFFWPSTSKGAPFFFDRFDGTALDPAPYLATPCPMPLNPLPRTPQPPAPAAVDPRSDPRCKRGVVGAFCRAYSISEAIEKFLPDRYSRRGPGRYTFTAGTTSGGLVVYDDLWADSHHDSDPAAGHVVNAFDLVRCHLFGGGPMNPDRVYVDRMVSFARRDPKVMAELLACEPPRKGRELPEGCYPDTIEGARKAILELLGRNIWYNEFSRATIVEGGLPWRPGATDWQDRDCHGLRWYLEGRGIKKENHVLPGLSNALMQRSRHPVKEYLEECASRPYRAGDLERIFVDYLGADDTAYTRAVTRLFFVGAVARIYEPGCKFDYCPVLQGPQGIGKSTVFAIMGGRWFSDSLSTLEGKEAMEQLRGKWLLEMGELSAMRRSDIEATKAFISRRTDSYRAAYARVVEDWPRQCVIGATTNQTLFLKGDCNRRFLPIAVDGVSATRSPFDDLPAARDALWAEALALYRAGTPLFLPPDLEAEARARQAEANEDADNPYVADLEVYLARPLPLGWERRDAFQRRQYFTGCPEANANLPTQQRTRVSPREFLWEYFGIRPADPYYRTKANDVAKALIRLGWVFVGPSRHCKLAYGFQKSYVRPIAEQAA